MIHEFSPVHFDNQYNPEKTPHKDSKMMLFYDNKILVGKREKEIYFPCYEEAKELVGDLIYLFSEDDKDYYLGRPKGTAEELKKHMPDYSPVPARELRGESPNYEAFAAMTALHLQRWYDGARFCGRCGHKTAPHPIERMMECPACGNKIYPRISPAIIVAVTDGEKLLLTKYAGRLKGHYALVAGFVEIGETAEECVRREVMEEVGIHIRDIRYYASQPWGYDGNLMLGYTAWLDGSHKINLDQKELSSAVWLSPEEIGEVEDHSSLTREMIYRFKEGRLF